jgi:hypothetical protein
MTEVGDQRDEDERQRSDVDHAEWRHRVMLLSSVVRSRGSSRCRGLPVDLIAERLAHERVIGVDDE